ncbi:MAG: hypothetical protein ACSLFC_14090, partial [Desulfuromonadales bacterium]
MAGIETCSVIILYSLSYRGIAATLQIGKVAHPRLFGILYPLVIKGEPLSFPDACLQIGKTDDL